MDWLARDSSRRAAKSSIEGFISDIYAPKSGIHGQSCRNLHRGLCFIYRLISPRFRLVKAFGKPQWRSHRGAKERKASLLNSSCWKFTVTNQQVPSRIFLATQSVHPVLASSMMAKACVNAVSISICDVSSKWAFSAGFKGLSLRPMSRASRF